MYYADIRPEFNLALSKQKITMTQFASDHDKHKSTVNRVAGGYRRDDHLREKIEAFIHSYNPNLLEKNKWFVETGKRANTSNFYPKSEKP